jgi:KTSC domain
MSPRPAVFALPFIALYLAAAGEENSSTRQSLAPAAKPRAAAAAADPAWIDRKTSIVISRIPRQPVRSSALAFVGYSKRLRILEIEFRKGAVYRYLDVPHSVYRSLMAAESKARYYDRNIRGHYRSRHVRPRTKAQHVVH